MAGAGAAVEDYQGGFSGVKVSNDLVPGAAGLIESGNGEGHFAFLDFGVYHGWVGVCTLAGFMDCEKGFDDRQVRVAAR